MKISVLKLLATCLVLLAFMPNGKSFAVEIPEYVSQEIRFISQRATNVHLVWGVNDWKLVPEEKRPPGTRLVEGNMHTPMQQQDGFFVTRVELAADSIIDFGFLSTEYINGEPVSTWYADNGDDFHLTVTPREPIEIEKPNGLLYTTADSSIKWLILGIGIGLGTAIVFVRRRGGSTFSVHQKLPVEIRMTKERVKAIIGVFSIVNLITLAGMWVFLRYFQKYNTVYEDAPGWVRLGLVQFNLATENVFASWYISMLMFLVAVACLLSFLADRQRFQAGRDRILSYGWIFLGLVFVALSADEIGSWHETIGMLPFLGSGARGWVRVLAVPIAIVAVFIATFAWLHLRRHRWSFWLMGLGLGLYIVNPFFELAEMALLGDSHNPGAMKIHDLLIWIEEGTELFGTTSFLAAAMLYASQSGSIRIEVRMVAAFVVTGLLGMVFTLGLLATKYAQSLIERWGSGIADNWFPAALSMMVCIVSIHLVTTRQGSRYSYYGMAVFAVILSVYYGANIRGWLIALDDLHLVIHGIFLLMIAFVAFGFIRRIDLWWYRLAVALWLILFSFILFSEPGQVKWTDIIITTAPILLLLPHFIQHSDRDVA
jgi:hypothetical protein